MAINVTNNGKFMAMVSHRTDGKQKKYRKVFSTMAEAQKWEAEALLLLMAGKPLSKGVGGDDRWTLKACLDKAYRDQWQGTKGEATALKNANAVLKFFGGKTYASDITTLRVREFIDALSVTNSGATINRKLAALSVMLKTAYKYGKIDRLPMLERQREAKAHPRFLTTEQVEHLVATANKLGWDKLADAITIATNTGLRQSELLSLTPKALDENTREIVLLDTKNGKPHRVPVPNKAWEAVERRVPVGLTKDELIYQWRKLADICGVVSRWHDLRHTYGSWLVQRGVPIETVSRLMNHSSITVTMRYAYLAPSNYHDAVSVLD